MRRFSEQKRHLFEWETFDVKTNISLLPVPSVTSFEARVAELLEGEKALILITILESEGSAPRHAGTKALFTHRGLEGTIGGGLLEARVLSEAEYCLDCSES